MPLLGGVSRTGASPTLGTGRAGDGSHPHTGGDRGWGREGRVLFRACRGV